MAEPRATTIQQRFGFKDDDLKTPLHDAIMVWLTEQMPSLIVQLTEGPRHWNESYLLSEKRKAELFIKREKESAIAAAQQASLEQKDWKIANANEHLTIVSQWPDSPEDPPPFCNATLSEAPTWEHAISSNQYIIGFIDMVCHYGMDSNLSMVFPKESYYGSPHPSLGCPYWEVKKKYGAFLFEVKTKLPTLGELIRQIQMYRHYVEHPFIVVSPDIPNLDILKAQKIGFVQYTPDKPGRILLPEK